MSASTPHSGQLNDEGFQVNHTRFADDDEGKDIRDFIRIAGLGRGMMFLDPEEALNLLSWLIQERTKLEHLAMEARKHGSQSAESEEKATRLTDPME